MELICPLCKSTIANTQNKCSNCGHTLTDKEISLAVLAYNRKKTRSVEHITFKKIKQSNNTTTSSAAPNTKSSSEHYMEQTESTQTYVPPKRNPYAVINPKRNAQNTESTNNETPNTLQESKTVPRRNKLRNSEITLGETSPIRDSISDPSIIEQSNNVKLTPSETEKVIQSEPHFQETETPISVQIKEPIPADIPTSSDNFNNTESLDIQHKVPDSVKESTYSSNEEKKPVEPLKKLSKRPDENSPAGKALKRYEQAKESKKEKRMDVGIDFNEDNYYDDTPLIDSAQPKYFPKTELLRIVGWLSLAIAFSIFLIYYI